MTKNSNDFLEPIKISPFEIFVRIVFYYIIVVTFMVFLQILTAVNLNELLQSELLTINLIRATTGIVGIGITYVFLRYDKEPLRWVGLFWTKDSLKLILWAAPVTIVSVMVTIIIEFLFNIIPQKFQLISLPAISITIFFTVLGIGIGEEVIYRGYIQKLVQERYSFLQATLVSSCLFGLNHFFLGAFLPDANIIYMITWATTATIFGISMSYVVKLTDYNLIFAICIHAFWDTVYFILQIDSFNYTTLDNMIIEIIAQIIGSVLILFLSYYIYKKINNFASS